MATYKEIKGVTVQTKDTDPVQNVGSWASGTSINTARSFTGGAGTQAANLVFGGKYDPSPRTITEQWDGSSWTEVGDLNTARQSMGAMGTSTSAVAAGGRVSTPADTAASETWNGSAWTEGNDLNSERYAIANRGAGTQTAGLCAGGRNKAPGAYDALTEEYNGTSWTEVNDLPSGVESGSGLGTQTAAGLWGGYTGSYRASGFLYDGTNWTATTDFPFPSGSASESGTTTAGLLFGIFSNNTPGYVANTVSWDGTAFTEENDLATARGGGGGGKAGLNTNQNAIMVGGFESGGTYYANVEDWNFPPVTQDKLKEGMIFLSGGTTLKGFGKAAGVPAGTWASGGALNTARGQAGAAGVSQDSAMVSAGRNLGPTTAGTTACEQYNGSSWTEVAENNTARSALSGGGTQTANFIAGGRGAPNTGLGNTEIWDGSGWTETTDLNTARAYVTGNGTQTAGMIAGGGPPTTAKVELWDGSSWTETTDLNTAKIYRSLFGGSTTTTASVCVGGENPQIGNSETWNGSSWTEGNDLNTARGSSGVAGVSTFGLVFGGQYDSGYYAQTEVYNGTSYTELADLSAANGYTVPANNSPNVSALAAGGFTPSVGTATEEWTAGLALADITVS